MQTFCTNLFASSPEQNSRLQTLLRLTTLRQAELKMLASDLDWNVWR